MHWAHSRGAGHKLHVAALCGDFSQIQIDSLSQWLDRIGGRGSQPHNSIIAEVLNLWSPLRMGLHAYLSMA